MFGPQTVLLAGSLSAGVGTAALVAYLWRHRGQPGANWFLVSLSAQAVFCFAGGGSLLVGDPAVRRWIEALIWATVCLTGPFFLAFTLAYTGRGALLRSRAAAAVGALVAANELAVLTAPVHDLVWRGFSLERAGGLAVATYEVAPLGYVALLTGIAMAGVGVLLLTETVISYGPLYRREAAAVALSSVVPTIALAAWLLGVDPVDTPVYVAAAFVPHVLFDAYAFVGQGMFETNPATRRAADRTAIDDIATPVVVLDPDDRVVDHNDAATPLFDCDPLGTPLSALLDVDDGILADGGDPVDDRLVSMRVAGDTREFSLSRSSLTDSAGSRLGTTLVFQDVTRERRREQRLSVLNRVLRHNLRNAMTVVVGNARLLTEDPDGTDVAAVAETIDSSASDLVDVGEKVRDFERVREAGARYRTVALADAVTEAVDDCHDGAADVSVAADDVDVETDPRLLSLVVANLVENALEHADDPVVGVAATAADGVVTLTVTDDGPGIPPGELGPLETGTETPLDHGTGIGLWIVEWSVTALGGTWSVDTDDDGTTVTVRLPDGEDEHVPTA